MKIGYNYNGNLVIQEVSSVPNFEFIEITPEIEIQIREMIKPILQDGVIVEGATQIEIDARKTQYNEQLQDYVTTLLGRSLVSSYAKKEKKKEYFDEQKEVYELKYLIAKKVTDNPLSPIATLLTTDEKIWYDAIVREKNKKNLENGTNINDLAYLNTIISQWDSSETRSYEFKSGVEELRQYVNIFIEKEEFSRVNQALVLIKEIINLENITIGTINNYRNQFNNI